MTPETLIAAFNAAWRGLDRRHADDPGRAARIRDRYLHRLREARTGELRRAVLVELLAEGSAGLPVDAAASLWSAGEADEWSAARDAALLAAAGGEPC